MKVMTNNCSLGGLKKTTTPGGLKRGISTILAALVLTFFTSVCMSAMAATTTANYDLVFEASWSASTHPTDFPSNPHFSGLVGGIHSGAVSFWEKGQLASPGIKMMAEMGSKTVLESEVSAAITAGTALAIVSGGGIAVSPGSVSISFTASQDFPLLTLTSMVAPSPDWFVGVTGLELFDGSSWSESVVMNLYVYDAGTDDGVTYTSPDSEANPHQPIFLMTTSPFDNGTPLGKFTLTRTDAPPSTPPPSTAAIPGLTLPGMIVLSLLLLGMGRRFTRRG